MNEARVDGSGSRERGVNCLVWDEGMGMSLGVSLWVE